MCARCRERTHRVARGHAVDFVHDQNLPEAGPRDRSGSKAAHESTAPAAGAGGAARRRGRTSFRWATSASGAFLGRKKDVIGRLPHLRTNKPGRASVMGRALGDAG